MCDIYSGVRLDFYAVLVPGPPHVLIRHLALENRLILRLHCEVCDALVDLQLFLYTGRKTRLRVQIMKTLEACRLRRRCYWMRWRNKMQ